jgi:hypothetical protein
MSMLPLLDCRITDLRGGGGGGGDIIPDDTEVEEGDESCERERLRCAGIGGGDFKLGVRLRLKDVVSSSVWKLCGSVITLDRLFGGGGGVGLLEFMLSAILRASLSSFADEIDVCVLLLDREGGKVPCRLALRARGIVGGILRGFVVSNTSASGSRDRLGDIVSLSMDAESR